MKNAITMITIMLIAVVLIVSCGESKTKNDKESDINDDISNSDNDEQPDNNNEKEDDSDFGSHDRDVSENDADNNQRNDLDAINPDDEEEHDQDEDVLENDVDILGCSLGEIQIIVCSKDNFKIQKQICDENGTWHDEEDCFKPLSSWFCTGQKTCMNDDYEIDCPSVGEDFSGQDAQYAKLGYCIPKSFTISGNAPERIVSDNNTGLHWQQILPELYYGCTGEDMEGKKCKWQEAVNYCNDLNYGGYNDWRLPTVEELETIVDYGKLYPAVDEAYFPNAPLKGFWSYSSMVGFADNAWYVDLADGDTWGDAKSSEYGVRCVRGSVLLTEHSFSEVEINDETIVIDSATNFQWTKDYSSEYKTWKEALSYCENLYFGGYSDWRLPNINELKTLINRNKYNAASDFPDMPLSEPFWSSSPCVYSIAYAWDIHIYSGYVRMGSMTNEDYIDGSGRYAICVR